MVYTKLLGFFIASRPLPTITESIPIGEAFTNRCYHNL